MSNGQELISALYAGWTAYQETMIDSIEPLDETQLGLRSAPHLRSVGEIVRHVIGARARWFHSLMGEGGADLETFTRWDRRGARIRPAGELVRGLQATWDGMQNAIDRWTPADWEVTWEGNGNGEPQVITRQWVIWHLIEHDLHHGGEISLTLGIHKAPAFRM